MSGGLFGQFPEGVTVTAAQRLEDLHGFGEGGIRGGQADPILRLGQGQGVTLLHMEMGECLLWQDNTKGVPNLSDFKR